MEPKPPLPRSDDGSSSTSWKVTYSTRWMTSCAMRSPRLTRKSVVRIGVDQQHLELAAVARVDEARGVETGHAVLERQPAAGLHEAGVALGDRDRGARGHERAAASTGQQHLVAGNEVGTGVTGAGVSRERQIGIETEEWDVEHGETLATDTMRTCWRGWTSK